MLPGGALCGRQLLSWLVPPDDASFLAAGMAVALSLRNPEARKAALEPMLQPNASTVWLCAALDVITQVIMLVAYKFLCFATLISAMMSTLVHNAQQHLHGNTH